MEEFGVRPKTKSEVALFSSVLSNAASNSDTALIRAKSGPEGAGSLCISVTCPHSFYLVEHRYSSSDITCGDQFLKMCHLGELSKYFSDSGLSKGRDSFPIIRYENGTFQVSDTSGTSHRVLTDVSHRTRTFYSLDTARITRNDHFCIEIPVLEFRNIINSSAVACGIRGSLLHLQVDKEEDDWCNLTFFSQSENAMALGTKIRAHRRSASAPVHNVPDGKLNTVALITPIIRFMDDLTGKLKVYISNEGCMLVSETKRRTSRRIYLRDMSKIDVESYA